MLPKDARKLDREGTQIIMQWCNAQTESYFDNLDLQQILRLYHATEDFLDFQEWEKQEPKEAAAFYRKVVARKY